MASPSLKYSKSSPSIPQTLDVTEIVTPAVSVDDFGGGPNGVQQTEESASSSVGPSRNVDMRYEKSRIKSFGDNWPHASIEPDKLARAGFFRIDKVDDHVQCPFCGLKLNDLEPDMDPEKEHRRWQPSCPFIQDLPCGNVPLGYHGASDSDEGNAEAQKDALCIVCGGELKNWSSDDEDPWIEHAKRFPQCPLLHEDKREQFMSMALGQSKRTEQVEGLEDRETSDVQPSASMSEIECQTEEEKEDVYEHAIDCYYMGNQRRGKFLILSNDQCDNRAYLPLTYSSDLKNCINVFAQLNFEVFLYENLSYSDLKSLLKTVSQEDHSNVDCFGVATFILERVSENTLNYNDCSLESDFYSIFGGKACPSLEGKPKLFLFNAYYYQESSKSVPKAPPESDFLAVFTSVVDKDSSEGELTSRVRQFCEELRMKGMKTEDVVSILGRVGYSTGEGNESCSYASSLAKRLFFPPKKR